MTSRPDDQRSGGEALLSLGERTALRIFGGLGVINLILFLGLVFLNALGIELGIGSQEGAFVAIGVLTMLPPSAVLWVLSSHGLRCGNNSSQEVKDRFASRVRMLRGAFPSIFYTSVAVGGLASVACLFSRDARFAAFFLWTNPLSVAAAFWIIPRSTTMLRQWQEEDNREESLG